MAFFVPPVLLIRKKRLIRSLMKANAYSADTAKRLDELDLLNPYTFPFLTVRMIKRNVISVTNDGKYYLCK